MNKKYVKKKQKNDLKYQIIKRQINEIDSFKRTIYELESGCREKDEIINSINVLRDDLLSTIDDLKAKGEKYDKLIAELKEMKKVMNQTVFKGRWKIIRLLLK